MTGNATPLSSPAVSVETRDEFSCHGEGLLIARYWPGIADRGFTESSPSPGCAPRPCFAADGFAKRLISQVSEAILSQGGLPM